MRQEEALVLLLSRLSFNKLTKVRIFHLVKNGIDWYEFLNICVKKNLICMAYKNLMDLNIIQLLPMAVINNMQYHFEQNLKQNQKSLHVSSVLVTHFKRNNILATPVKGLRFLTTIYGKEPGVRILSDIDFIASANDQSRIHDFMKNSGYNIYLINDQDAFCSINVDAKSCFYIKFEDTNLHGKLRIDFNFTYPDNWIQLIQSSNQPIYEFLYLCNSYYLETYSMTAINNITSYNYVKLIDIHEYIAKYLSDCPIEKIYEAAEKFNIKEKVMFTITCLDNLYTDIYHV